MKNSTTHTLLVSAREVAQILGIRRDEVSDFLNSIGVAPMLETATRKKSVSRGIRNHRKWSLPQIMRRMEAGSTTTEEERVETKPASRRAFRQPAMKKLCQ